MAELVTAQVRVLSVQESSTLHCVSSLHKLAFIGVGQNEEKMRPNFISNQNRKDMFSLKISLPNSLFCLNSKFLLNPTDLITISVKQVNVRRVTVSKCKIGDPCSLYNSVNSFLYVV